MEKLDLERLFKEIVKQAKAEGLNATYSEDEDGTPRFNIKNFKEEDTEQ